jgi:hypothetical protein
VNYFRYLGIMCLSTLALCGISYQLPRDIVQYLRTCICTQVQEQTSTKTATLQSQIVSGLRCGSFTVQEKEGDPIVIQRHCRIVSHNIK